MKVAEHKPKEADRDEGIRLDPERSEANAGFTNWGALLVLFMRVVAGLWILRGLLHWQTILGSDVTPFEALPTGIAIAVVFFAVADLIAAVGLWIASAWGGVLWLFSAMASIIVSLALPDFRSGGRLLFAIDFALIAVYFVLTWYAARERAD